MTYLDVQKVFKNSTSAAASNVPKMLHVQLIQNILRNETCCPDALCGCKQNCSVLKEARLSIKKKKTGFIKNAPRTK